MPFLSNLWGRITGKDAGEFVPKQQGVSLDRVGDFETAQPYGLYANLPQGQLFKVLDEEGRVILGITVERKDNVEQNEVTLWHPGTKSNLHFKNSGNLDIDTAVGNGDININTVNANITASEDVNVTCKNADIIASGDVDVTCNNASVTAALKADVDSNTSTVTCITSLALIAPITTVNSTTSMTFTSPLMAFVGNVTFSGTMLNGGVNVGGTHIHSQGNDSDGSAEVDTGFPHS